MIDLTSKIHFIDFVLLAFALEGFGLIAYHYLTRGGLRPLEVVLNLASGAFLVVALRLALTDARYQYIGACLFGSFIAHIFDLRRRWPRK